MLRWLLLFILFSAVLLIANRSYSQTTIWSVDFETGYSDNDATAQDNNAPTGADWTKTGTPSNWWRVENDNAITGSLSMNGRNTDGVMTWTSEAISIAGYSNVTISIDIAEFGCEAGDIIETFYNIDGGGNTEFGDGNGDGGFTSATNTIAGLSGSSMTLVVTLDNNGASERLVFDNILVTGTLIILGKDGPGGVGETDGSGELELWLPAEGNTYTDAGSTSATDGQDIQQWNDQSGNTHHASETTSAEQPHLNTNAVNGFSTVEFDGSDDRILSTGLTTNGEATIFTVLQINAFTANTNDGIIQAGPTGTGFSTSGGNKTIGMWVNTSSNDIWGRGVESGGTQQNISQVTSLSTGQFYAISQDYDGSDINQYVNGAAAGTVSYDGTLQSWTDFGIGRQGSETMDGEIAEVIAFKDNLNNAQRTIIQNYLAAKYGLSLSTGEFYDEDDVANGNFDYEVAGIGQGNDGLTHEDAQGTGIVRVSSPAGPLSNNEYYIWGHDNGSLILGSSDLPSGVGQKLERIWRGSETGEVGNVTISFDLASLSGTYAATDIRLLIDRDNDGNFSDETSGTGGVISGATNTSGDIYEWTVIDMENNERFTIGIVTLGHTGPGGVGLRDGSDELEIWLRADDLDGDNDFTDNPTDGTSVSTWEDYSGNANDFTNSGTNRPTYSTTGTYNAVNFDASLATTQYLNAASTGSYSTGSAFFAYNGVNSGTSNSLFDNGSFSLRVEQFSNTNNAGFTRYGVSDYASSISTVFGSDAIYSYHRDGVSTNVDIRVNGSSESLDVGSSAAGIPYDRIGSTNSGTDEASGDFYEVILYSTELNDAQLNIVDNYLSAKYGGITIASDLYDEDDGGNGDYDYDVAGIGQAADGSNHLDAQGTGIVRVNTPSNMGNSEYLIWGHDNGALSSFGVTDLPTGVESRLERVWRPSETGEVGTVTISFDLTDVFGSITASDLRLLIDSDNDGTFSDESGGSVISGATNTSGDIYEWTGVDLEDNQRFTIGSIDATATPLPIVLIDFSAQLDHQNKVELRWSTASEINNDYFTIERSSDAFNWEEIQQIYGAGNSSIENNYLTYDNEPLRGTSYYRLKQTDFDGQFEYFNIESINLLGSSLTPKIYPNPTKGIITIECEGIDRNKFNVYTSQGIELPINSKLQEIGNDKLQFDLSALKAGLYLVAYDRKFYRVIKH